MTDWTMQIFPCKTHKPGSEPIILHIGGWVKGDFGLDPRRYDLSDWGEETAKGWVITHIPTGYVVRAIKAASPDKAKEIADIIASACDWNFTDPDAAKALSQAVKKVMADHSEIAGMIDFHSPLWLDHA